MKGRSKKRRKIIRILGIVFLPVLLFAKAIVSIWRAFHSDEEKLVARDRKLPPAAPYHREKRVVQVRDGTPIIATVFIPAGAGPFPAIVMVHSWMFWRIQCDLLYAPDLARRGYIVLTYDCRGWGSSGGEVACASPEYELLDCEDMITWLISPDSNIPVDPERIGITGISYGGGHSFLMATRDERIKVSVPMSGWTDLYTALAPNGCWKWVWSLFLFVGSLWAVKFDPKNVLVKWLKSVMVERNLSLVRGDLDERSAIYDVGAVSCPMFIVHSWNDDLFEPNQILKFYERLNVPKKLYMANGIHGIDSGRGDIFFPNEIWDEARRWFDYWLKGEENGIDEEPPVKYYEPWDGNMADAQSWPPENVEFRKYYLRGDNPATVNSGMLFEESPSGIEPAELLVNNTVSNGHSSGLPILRQKAINKFPIPGVPFSIPSDSAVFTTPVLEKDTVMVGTPYLSSFINSSSHECQLNAFLYDVSPKGIPRLITHGCAMRFDMEEKEIEEFHVEMIACAHKFPEGHRIRLVMCASDPLFVFPSLVPSYYRVFHRSDYPSSLALPLV
ncbi:MAG: CocE/NonD family hydrolase, partial [Actinomycetota bacterium]|nr:CocE/NonD family hydrolase [Actinomycetota bacterium]